MAHLSYIVDKTLFNKAKEIKMDMIFKTDFSPNDNVQNVIDLSESC